MTTPSDSPSDLDALVALAGREHRAGRLAEAAAACRQILTLKPDLAEAHNNLGVICAQQGQFDEATSWLQRAIALKPGYVEAYNNLGGALLRQGKFDEAVGQLQRAIDLKPDFVEAHSLAHAILGRGSLDAAAAHFEQVLAAQPNLAEARFGLGNTLWQIGRFEEAIAQFRQGLALRPDDVARHDFLARLLLDLRRFDQAEAEIGRVLSLVPDHADARFGLATCYLVQGDFDRGWPAYEVRLRVLSVPPQPDLPRWNGEPLSGRRLILIGEQGLGDTLQFMRYARLLRSQGAHVTLAVQPPLARLLASHPDLDAVIVAHPKMEYPAADFYLYLLSLPGLLGTNLTNIPAEIPYLAADPNLKERWRQELSKIEGFKVGIVWRVTHEFPPYMRRTVSLAEFAPLARVPGVRLISLQKGAGSEQVKQVDFPVVDFGDRLDEAAGPFMDTAAIIANLDLVVAVDTSITHLAGALGAPVFVPLHFSGDWRWLCDREDSPWYPNVRLVRQKSFGAWPDVFERMAQAIQQRHSQEAPSGRIS